MAGWWRAGGHQAKQQIVIFARARMAFIGILLRGTEVEIASRCLRNGADAAEGVVQQPGDAGRLIALKLDAQDAFAAKRSDEQAAAKFREGCSAIEVCVARANRRRELKQRRDHAVVRVAMVDDRPAVVVALLNPVDLVAAERAVLRFDQPVGAGLEVDALRIAMAVCPDLRVRGPVLREGIVERGLCWGSPARNIQAQDLAISCVELLRTRRFVRVTGGGVEEAVWSEAQAAASVIAP
jgi:hypothetical protein